MENNNIEWKEIWKDEYLKFVCAFANTKNGGIMKIGVDDDGKIVGLINPEDDLKKISDTIINTLGIYPDISLDEKTMVITIDISPSPMPIELRGRYWIKVGNTTHEIRGRALERFVMRRIGTSWTEAQETRAEVKDLDRNALSEFRKAALEKNRLEKESLSKPDEEMLKRINLISDGCLKRSAVLLFHPHPNELFTGAYMKIAMFKGPEILYMDEIDGPLIELPKKALEVLCSKYIIRPISYKGLQRIENDPYPIPALREILLNSVMHADYSSGNPIQIKVYDDRIVVSNVGGLPEDWTISDLLGEHVSIRPNPSLAETFYRAGMVESYGRGIERIMDCYEGKDATPPSFDATQTTFRVTLTSTIGSNQSAANLMPTTIDEKLNTDETKVLNSIIKGSISYSEICNDTALGRSTVAKLTSSLMKKGLISRVGSTKKGFWSVNEKR